MSLLKGTVLYKSKLNLIIILKIIELWSEEIRLLKIAKGLNLERHAVSRIIKLMSKKLVVNYYSKKML